MFNNVHKYPPTGRLRWELNMSITLVPSEIGPRDGTPPIADAPRYVPTLGYKYDVDVGGAPSRWPTHQ